MISISPNNNGHPSFTSGITRKLARNYCSCEDDVIEILNKHPQKNGIAGQLPISWIEKLNASEFVNNKREIIKDIYQQFASIVKLASENIIEASDKVTADIINTLPETFLNCSNNSDFLSSSIASILFSAII